MTIDVTRAAIEAMEQAMRAADPRESCGILLGEGMRVAAFIETRNVHPQPETFFEIDPQALIHAHRVARGGGPHVLGYFHSHPAGPPKPSQNDRELAAGDGMIWAIGGGYGGACERRGEIRFFRSGKDGFEPLGSAIFEG